MQSPTVRGVALPQQPAAAEKVEETSPPRVRLSSAWWVWALAGSLFAVYSAVSLRLHQRMLSHSYDLGIFEQVIRSYASGHLPVSELKGPDFPALGDHFSPILVLVAPFYRVWSSPECLLVVQAALLAVSVVPLAFWARKALGDSAARVIAVCYGLSWGIASGVGFDFHEVAFAVPLISFSLAALSLGRPRTAVAWALPLLLVKEDLGLTVAAIGLLIVWRGDRRLGLLTAAAGLIGTALCLLAILPAINPSGTFGYWWLADSPQGTAGSGGGLAGFLYKSTIGLITPETKLTTFVLLLAPTLFLALRSSLMLIAVPTLAWRFLSSNSVHWGTDFHYSMVLMPIVFAAFIDALSLRRSNRGSMRRYLLGSAAVALLILPNFPLWQLVQPETWRTSPRVALAHKIMESIPDNATVQASTLLVPQLTNRTSVSVYGWYSSRPHPDWIMVDTWVPTSMRWPQSWAAEQQSLAQAKAHGYRTVVDEQGFILLRRRT
ncbi:DUF2079 domain-containing protein [Streptomyces sp. MK7]|uniref:DUF2079 domain-containing protein n=1 Tax=Streptomyces sp. MK7 TaxID=3067635 RepID=UPI00292F8438|nr:DUF2079 domain-containing protein [Streptomyces sp. MK7]